MIGGSLEIEVDLVAMEAGSDRLSVTGQAVLDGDLVIVEAAPATLGAGESLTIVDFGSRSGVFSNVTLLSVGPDLSLACIYGDTDITLRATLAGDINLDDRVDEVDATLLAANWNTGPGLTWSQGDFNGDGFVDNADAAILAGNWLQVAALAASVPEPNTIVVLLAAVLFGAWQACFGRGRDSWHPIEKVASAQSEK